MRNRANAETKGRKGEQYSQRRKLGGVSEPAVFYFFCGLRVAGGFGQNPGFAGA